MKLPLKVGLPLLAALMLGLAVTDGAARFALLLVAMGVALWSAFSLPHPGPRPPEPPLFDPDGPEGDQGDDQGSYAGSEDGGRQEPGEAPAPHREN